MAWLAPGPPGRLTPILCARLGTFTGAGLRCLFPLTSGKGRTRAAQVPLGCPSHALTPLSYGSVGSYGFGQSFDQCLSSSGLPKRAGVTCVSPRLGELADTVGTHKGTDRCQDALERIHRSCLPAPCSIRGLGALRPPSHPGLQTPSPHPLSPPSRPRCGFSRTLTRRWK